MNTNFLRSGGFIQTENGEFLVFSGQDLSSCALDEAKSLIEQGGAVLYRPHFWDFLKPMHSAFYPLKAIKSYSRLEFIKFLTQPIRPGITHPNIVWSSDNTVEYSKQFEWSMEQFKNGTLKKTVPIFRFDGVGQFDLRETLLKVLEQDLDGYFYGHWGLDNVDHFSGCLGVSPERFLQAQLDKKTMYTSALAGTWKKIENPNQKIRDEHQFVIQDILEQLNSIELLKQSETYVSELTNFNHLKTDFNFNFKTTDNLIKTLHNLHPTSALGLYPRRYDMYQQFYQFSLQKEREFHGAPFGFFVNKELHSIVSIRNIQWTKTDVSIFSGGGVTIDSLFESEWEELNMKKQSVVNLLGLQ